MPPNQPAAVASAIAAIWQRSQPQVRERLALLDRVASTVPLPPELKEEGRATSHKLAGSLGMFGFPEGTQLASLLEQQLEASDPDQAVLAQLALQLRTILFS